MKQLALALLLLLLAMAATAVRAQEAIRVLDARAENRFPEGVLFTLTAQGAAPIQRVTLNYNLGGRANTFAAPTFTPGTTVRAELQLKVDGRLYIAPGTVITYYWQLEDEAGRRLNTEATTITYDDTRFSWQRLSQGKLTLSWYGGSRAGAERLLQAGADAIDRIAALTGADMAGTAAKVWAYASSQDMQPVLVRRSEAFERNVVTAGERVSDDTVVILTSG
ncbi:MAG TPA: hypothetical protein VJ256_05845, partial [Dehalococcoidia bacterium]|nr:hypothetical protein [Dehalococcoidia bacterium]